jgi:hypothetical protein
MRTVTRMKVTGGEFSRDTASPDMHQALIAAACCALTATPPPLAQNWSDTGLIATDDDWSRVPAIVGYRGDGMVAEPGIDPRTVLADGSGTPVDVTANRSDPGAIGLPAGVAEFELPNPVVAIESSATAGAPHLVVALDTRGRAGIAVRLALRDIDASAADAVEPVALQYRVGATGDFANAPGGYVADATTGPGEATRVTEVRTVLPAAADDQALLELRVIATDAGGRDEWVGIDDIEVSAGAVSGSPDCGGADPPPAPIPEPPMPPPPPGPGPAPDPQPGPPGPELTGLALTPDTFRPARTGPAIVRRGRAGTGLRFRLSKPALVRFQVLHWGERAGLPLQERTAPERARFQVRGRRGLNRMRFTGRIRGRPLPEGTYILTAVATDRAGRSSAPSAARFRVGRVRD